MINSSFFKGGHLFRYCPLARAWLLFSCRQHDFLVLENISSFSFFSLFIPANFAS